MNIHILWNECVDKTNNISSCIELYTKKIIKEKDEEELRFLFEMNSRYKLFNGNIFMNEMVKKRIEEIKQNLKENEE